MSRCILFSALLASLLSLPAILRGIGVMSDSVTYLSAAQNLAQHGKLVTYRGNRDLSHPPGYSLAMTPFIRVGFSMTDAAILVNWLSLFGTCLFAWLILARLSGERGWPWLALGSGIVTLSPGLFLFGRMALSEALFTAILLAVVWLAIETRKKLWD